MTTKKTTKKSTKLPQFVYDVVLWDETGNIILFKKRVKIRRAKQITAKDFIIKQYPRPYFVELWSINK
jgi:hypothetical protein